MTTFEIHKGVDAPVEFKGLRSQYLFICAGGLIGAFLIVVVLYMCGVGQFLCLGVGGALSAGVVMLTYRLNEKYGTYGLMKALAVKLHPRRITNRRRVKRLIRSSHV